MQIHYTDRKECPERLIYGVAETPIGPVFSGVCDGAVYFIGLLGEGQDVDDAMARRRPYFAAGTALERDDAVAAPFIEKIVQEWRGQKTDLELRLRGTPFQQDVWRALSNIPKGQVCTYADIARAIGRPKAVRAVGTANGSNPISLLVPCHRVVPMSGGVGGYGWGGAVKRRLLEAEGAIVA